MNENCRRIRGTGVSIKEANDVAFSDCSKLAQRNLNSKKREGKRKGGGTTAVLRTPMGKDLVTR